MSKLVIVESPTKVKSIKKYLGPDYEVMASMGHIRDLPKSRLGVDIEKGFVPQYMNMADKKELIKSLKNAAAQSEMVYLATDPDREGEAISWHLAQILALNTDEANRVAFNEITESGVKSGMANPRSINQSLVDAQQARRVLDRIVGYKISPFLWKKVKSGLSAGRVQSVALRLIVDREKEISDFVSQEYWTIDAKLLSGRKSFESRFYGTADGEKLEILDGQNAEKIVSELDGAQYVVLNVKKGTRNKQPAPPFTTSTMQQEASRKLNFNGQRTMKIAQQLYEGVDIPGMGVTGLITYMRTDSLRISEEARFAAGKYITSRWGEKYLPKKPRYFKTKSSAQDAHEAIRPTNISLAPESIKDSLSAEQYKLYKLIWERFIASLMSACVQDTMAVDIGANNNYIFKSSGYSVKFDGYTVLYEEGRDVESDEGVALPEMNEGDVLKLKALVPNQHFTQPPMRYTEPTLIKALDENGIGRPSTYAPIISNILQREYIERDKKSLKPTSLGTIVTEIMKTHFKKIVDIKFTAGMESNLDKIEAGDLDWQNVLEGFYGDFEETLKKAENSMDGVRVKVPAVESDVVCEKCGRKMVVKSSRFGKFLACPGYPECKNTKPMPEDDIKQPCPKCGAKLVKRVKRNTNKTFYGCSNYPNCDFAAPGLPTGDVCKECGSFILKGFKGRKYCMNADCPTRKKK